MTLPAHLSYGYQELMPNLVKDILMVASPYDCFILEEDGRFSDRLLGQYMQLDLSAPPHFKHVTSGKEAMKALRTGKFDLVMTTPHCADITPLVLAKKIRHKYPDIPVAMMTYDRAEARSYCMVNRSEAFSQVFLWSGDPKLLVAMVKSVEDMINVGHDTREGLVRVIIVVEDSPEFYSSYLPAMYHEVLVQVQSLIPERLNERDRHFRMHARPKILLARNYEEASDFLRRYGKYLLGVICDLHFPLKGKMTRDAGIRFIKKVRKTYKDIPVLIQSRELDFVCRTQDLGAYCLDKNSPKLLKKIRRFMKKNFGFGPFIFNMPDGTEVARAATMEEMPKILEQIPRESLIYHSSLNHISNWLMARSEFKLALDIRPLTLEQFDDVEDMRKYLVQVFSNFISRRQRGQVTEFSVSSDFFIRDFARVGRGSLGGKARGLAYVNNLLATHQIHDKYPEINIFTPRTSVICTDFFDRFIEQNQILDKISGLKSNEEISKLFLQFPLDLDLAEVLTSIISSAKYPLAVRSSSLNEDSQFQPLAGLYQTIILPNNHSSMQVRLRQLSRAIRMVYASVYFDNARNYLKNHSMRIEEEKMAVLIQRLVGQKRGNRFYPDFSGVAQSYNYYPIRYMNPKDGIATVALGLGQSVVEGGKALRFCPKHPQILPQISTPQKALRASQREFFALDLDNDDFLPSGDEGASLRKYSLEDAFADGTLESVGATYNHQNDMIYDTVYRDGAKLINFSGILKHGRFPLASLLDDLLRMGVEGMGVPVEMEFAVSLNTDREQKPEMAVLQMRPLVASGHDQEVNLEDVPAKAPRIVQGTALGNGIIPDICDIIYLSPAEFKMADSRKYAHTIGVMNHKLRQEDRPYMLIGPGRWGTSDPWLGIPVIWTQVAGACVIVEFQLPNTPIDPSQGTHFFHNLTALRVAYFSIENQKDNQGISFDWLEKQTVFEKSGAVRHVRFSEPLEALIDGRKSWGFVLPQREVNHPVFDE